MGLNKYLFINHMGRKIRISEGQFRNIITESVIRLMLENSSINIRVLEFADDIVDYFESVACPSGLADFRADDPKPIEGAIGRNVTVLQINQGAKDALMFNGWLNEIIFDCHLFTLEQAMNGDVPDMPRIAFYSPELKAVVCNVINVYNHKTGKIMYNSRVLHSLLCHEIQHAFQEQFGSKLGKFYFKVNHENAARNESDSDIIEYGVYFFSPAEIDARMQELFSALCNKGENDYRITNWYDTCRETEEAVESIKGKPEEVKQLERRYNTKFSTIEKFLHRGINAFRTKMGKVISAYRAEIAAEKSSDKKNVVEEE